MPLKWQREVVMNDNLMHAFEIMGKGMASIFAVIFLLTLIVILMSRITEFRNKKDNSQQDEA